MPKERVLNKLHHFARMFFGFSLALNDELLIIWPVLLLGRNNFKRLAQFEKAAVSQKMSCPSSYDDAKDGKCCFVQRRLGFTDEGK